MAAAGSISGANQWGPFRTTGNPSTQERNWLARIDAVWPGLSANRRQRVRAYADRWGPNMKPFDPDEAHSNFAR